MGCCCSSSRISESDRAPTYIHPPQYVQEHERFSSANNQPPASAGGDASLDTSTPDTYRAPPAPLPYDVDLTGGDLKKSDRNIKTDYDQEPLKVAEDESVEKTPTSVTSDEEDVCPICLEEYDEVNPRHVTKCEHHFHLSCILEWMERSDACPVCDQTTVIDEMYE